MIQNMVLVAAAAVDPLVVVARRRLPQPDEHDGSRGQSHDRASRERAQRAAPAMTAAASQPTRLSADAPRAQQATQTNAPSSRNSAM